MLLAPSHAAIGRSVGVKAIESRNTDVSASGLIVSLPLQHSIVGSDVAQQSVQRLTIIVKSGPNNAGNTVKVTNIAGRVAIKQDQVCIVASEDETHAACPSQEARTINGRHLQYPQC
jgi:hypothetical protein